MFVLVFICVVVFVSARVFCMMCLCVSAFVLWNNVFVYVLCVFDLDVYVLFVIVSACACCVLCYIASVLYLYIVFACVALCASCVPFC